MNNTKNALCVALGDFDGVHLGHLKVLCAAVDNKMNLTPAVYTFKNNCKGAQAITDNETKSKIFQSVGIKHIIFDDFEKIKHLSPALFVQNILNDRLHAKVVICGVDFKFGKNAIGDAELLKQLCLQYDIKVEIINHFLNGNKKLSSTDIRKLIKNGDMRAVTKMLGRYFSISGTVEHGKKLGSKNCAPTINIPLHDNLVIPAFGVYISKININGKSYNGIANIGTRPSVEQNGAPNIEANIFDFNGDLYGAKVTVEFIEMIRPEIKFDSKNALFEQIQYDIKAAKAYFNGEANEDTH